MFKLLSTFIVVYETRSFSDAAAQLFIAQPTVSHQVQQLEQELDVQLFTRGRRQIVTPTRAADHFYEAAQRILAEWRTTRRTVQELTTHRPLALIVSQTVAENWVVPLVAARTPYRIGDIAVANSARVLQAVTDQQADFGIIEQPLMAADIERIQVGTDQLVIAGPPDCGDWLIREEGSALHFYTTQYLAGAGIHPQTMTTVNHLDVIRRLLQTGSFRALVSAKSVPPDVPVTPLPDAYQRGVYLIYQSGVAWRAELAPQLAQKLQAILTPPGQDD